MNCGRTPLMSQFDLQYVFTVLCLTIYAQNGDVIIALSKLHKIQLITCTNKANINSTTSILNTRTKIFKY